MMVCYFKTVDYTKATRNVNLRIKALNSSISLSNCVGSEMLRNRSGDKFTVSRETRTWMSFDENAAKPPLADFTFLPPNNHLTGL